MREKFLKEVSMTLMELSLKATSIDENRLINDMTKLLADAGKTENITIEVGEE